MNDKHFQTVEEIQNQIYSKMSFAQKWETLQQLRAMAWTVKAAGIRALHPKWNDKEVQDEVKKIFLYATT